MKRFISITIFILLGLVANAQYRGLWFNASQYFTLGDSTVTIWGEDTLTNPPMVRTIIAEELDKTKIDSAAYSDSTGYSDTTAYSLIANYAINVEKQDSTWSEIEVYDTSKLKSIKVEKIIHDGNDYIGIFSDTVEQYAEDGSTYLLNVIQVAGENALWKVSLRNSTDSSIFSDNNDSLYYKYNNTQIFRAKEDEFKSYVPVILKPIIECPETEGALCYSNVKKNLIVKNNTLHYEGDVNREINVRFYNATGETVYHGNILRSIGSYITAEGDTIFQGDFAGNASRDSLVGIAMVTTITASGEIGECTLIGEVHNISHGLGSNSILYLDHKGSYTTVSPEPPYFSKIIGKTDGDYSIYFNGLAEAKYDPLPHFAMRFNRETETITNTGQNIGVLVSNATNDLYTVEENNGFLRQGDTIRTLQNATYFIFINHSFQGDAATADAWRLAIYIDGVEESSKIVTSNSSNYVTISASCTIDLTTSNWISARIINTTSATRSSVFTDGTINVNYVSEL